jgi:hypothetical protein
VSGLVKDADMKVFSGFLRIIGLCVASLLLASCSLVKLGYGQLPDLTYWWIDSYIDVTDAQTPRLRRELDELAQWHRTNELPRLVLLLQKAQQLAPAPISPAQACALFEDGRERFNAVTARAEGLVLWLAPSLECGPDRAPGRQICQGQQGMGRRLAAGHPRRPADAPREEGDRTLRDALRQSGRRADPVAARRTGQRQL